MTISQLNDLRVRRSSSDPLPSADSDARIRSALQGETIYGDDFNLEEIERWFRDEMDGYASLQHIDSQTCQYVYHAMDAAYAWQHLRGSSLHVLGLGSAYGSEFKPILSRIQSLTIVEAGEKFLREEVGGVPVKYVRPEVDGRLRMESDIFDLITAFGVLHHIPNVSAVFKQLVRVLKPGGRLVIREPVTSMGDWRRPRPGLTARERGIPKDKLLELARAHSCTVISSQLIGFGPLIKLATLRQGVYPWNSGAFVRLDRVLSALFSRNYTYHRTNLLRRFAPAIGYWVLSKNSGGHRADSAEPPFGSERKFND